MLDRDVSIAAAAELCWLTESYRYAVGVRAERHGFDIVATARASLYADLNIKTGTVVGKIAARHTRQEFVAFLGALVVAQPRRQEIPDHPG